MPAEQQDDALEMLDALLKGSKDKTLRLLPCRAFGINDEEKAGLSKKDWKDNENAAHDSAIGAWYKLNQSSFVVIQFSKVLNGR